MDPIIRVEHLGKKYRIKHTQKGYVALRDVVTNLFSWRSWFRSSKKEQEDFWALQDVNFEIQKGEVLGIIGANGAGKSTLLKILSSITPPTNGEVHMNGRVISLLEVGTGFHPELTGRENIYLNGAILGMTRKEIEQKFDAIVTFSGVETFLDTPVKRFSSGMQVRLAFAVAAHLEPDILIIDEVLAVGDASFQKKCLGKMEEVTKQDGRTILFVSHNMDAIAKLCQRCVLLEHGTVKMIGNVREVIGEYLTGHEMQQASVALPEDSKKPIQVRAVRVRDKSGNLTSQLFTEQRFSVEIDYDVRTELKNSYVGFTLIDMRTQFPLLDTKDIDTNPALYQKRQSGCYTAIFNFNQNIFNQGMLKLFVYVGVFPQHKGSVDKHDGLIHVSFIDNGSFASQTLDGKRTSALLLKVPTQTLTR